LLINNDCPSSLQYKLGHHWYLSCTHLGELHFFLKTQNVAYECQFFHTIMLREIAWNHKGLEQCSCLMNYLFSNITIQKSSFHINEFIKLISCSNLQTLSEGWQLFFVLLFFLFFGNFLMELKWWEPLGRFNRRHVFKENLNIIYCSKNIWMWQQPQKKLFPIAIWRI
jgi:hypothetical protein